MTSKVNGIFSMHRPEVSVLRRWYLCFAPEICMLEKVGGGAGRRNHTSQTKGSAGLQGERVRLVLGRPAGARGGGARAEAEKGEHPVGQYHCMGKGQLILARALRLGFCF